mgnify:CR=1 FL=1
MSRPYTLRENLRPGDLKDLIDPMIAIDRHVPKLGSNADTIVIAFKCESKLSAQDLGEFLEWSTNNILDVEVSESSDKQGKFLVYCEVTRIPGVTQKILDIVKDCEHITNKQEWKFIGMDGSRRDLTIDNLNFSIVQDPKIYSLPADSRAYYQRMKNLTNY